MEGKRPAVVRKQVSGTVFEERGEERDGAGALDADGDKFSRQIRRAVEDYEAMARRPAPPLRIADWGLWIS